MTDEEIKAIEIVNAIVKVNEDYLKDVERQMVNQTEIQAMETVLNLIQKQKEEIEYYKSQKRYDDQFKHELLEEIRCKSLTIDSLNKILDDRLICIQGGRGLYAKLKGLDKEYLIREYLSMYKMCKQNLEKKDKIINFILKEQIEDGYLVNFYNLKEAKQYYERKVENEN